MKKQRKQIQGVHDGEPKNKKKQQTIRRKNLWGNSMRRKKLNDRRTIRGAPAPRPIKKSLLA